MWSFCYLTITPMQALVSAVWSRSEVELTHTISPGFKRCLVNFYIYMKKEGEAIFCFHVITLSFTFSRIFWKPCPYASVFIEVLWLCLFNLSTWAQSIPYIFFHCSQRQRCWPLSSVWWLACDGSLSLATAHTTFLWATLLLSASSPSPKIQKHILLALALCLSFLRKSRL